MHEFSSIANDYDDELIACRKLLHRCLSGRGPADAGGRVACAAAREERSRRRAERIPAAAVRR